VPVAAESAPTVQPRRDPAAFLSFAGATAIPIRGAHADLTAALAPAGVRLSTLRADPTQREALNAAINVERYPLVHLNTALLEDALFIAVAPGVDAGAFDLRFTSGSAAENFSRVCINLGPGSRLALVEQHHEDMASNSVLTIHVGANAKLEHTRVLPQTTPPAWHLVSVHVGDDGSYALTGHALGSLTRRSDVHVCLDGRRAATDIDLACAARGRDRLDHQLVVEHIGIDTVSRQTVHGIAADSSQLTFNGRIHIHPGAQRSDARLTNKNLLLDRSARINTKPELEIYANDVKCSHGATVGQIDPAQMFYLRARGLDEVTARAMLTRAFLAGALTPWMRDAGVLGIYAELFAS
jgi:Fe-S cluster assembly protein SufD